MDVFLPNLRLFAFERNGTVKFNFLTPGNLNKFAHQFKTIHMKVLKIKSRLAIKYLLFIFPLTLTHITKCYGQKETTSDRGFSVEMGYSLVNGSPCLFGAGNFRVDEKQFKIRARQGFEFFTKAPNLTEFKDFSFLYGKLFGKKENSLHFSLSGGIGLLTGKQVVQNRSWGRRLSSSSNPTVVADVTSLILTFEPELVLNANIIGVGLGLGIDLYSEGILFGPRLKICLGKM